MHKSTCMCSPEALLGGDGQTKKLYFQRFRFMVILLRPYHDGGDETAGCLSSRLIFHQFFLFGGLRLRLHLLFQFGILDTRVIDRFQSVDEHLLGL